MPSKESFEAAKPSDVPKLAVAQMRGSLSVSFDTEHQMDSTLNDKLAGEEIAKLGGAAF